MMTELSFAEKCSIHPNSFYAYGMECPLCVRLERDRLKNAIRNQDLESPYHTDDTMFEFQLAMANEIKRSRELYPGNLRRYVALTGEAGEVMHEAQRILTGRGSLEHLRTELIQLAAMCYRLASESDPIFSEPIQHRKELS